MPLRHTISECRQSRKVSPGDDGNISCLHHGEQAIACTNMQQTTIYHRPQDGYRQTEPKNPA